MSEGNNKARERRICVFMDTKNRYETDDILRKAVKESIKNQIFVAENSYIDEEMSPLQLKDAEHRKTATILVSRKRSLEAASDYLGKKVCVHNFASATNPGGGVTKGSSAQEEAICRCSTLYPCLNDVTMWKAFYKSHREQLQLGKMDASYSDDCIYTPNVVVFKSDTDEPELLPQQRWFTVDVITCAAPNLREHPSNSMNPESGSAKVRLNQAELKALHIKRAKRIMEIAKRQGAQVLILGAFGCGAFQNPPQIVAEAYKEALIEYRCAFETVEFAIYCSQGKQENFDAFRQVFG